MTKLLFLALGTSFILSACASSQNPPAQEQPTLSAAPEEHKSYANSVLSASIDAQQERIEALEYELAKLQTQVNALSKTPPSPAIDLPPTPTKPKPEATVPIDEQQYHQAQALLQRKEYVAMVTLLKGYANGGNGSLMAQNNMFLLATAHFNLGNCEAAIGINRRFANDYRQHPNAPRALYNIANCQLSMKQNDVAHTTLRTLIRTYPNSTEAQRAKILLK
ncbi:tol-pal system YbgF family protein [Neisseriaceae bacterium CLB008]